MIAVTRPGRRPVEVSGRFLLAGLGFVACYVVLDWVSFLHPFLPVGFTPWNPQVGLCIAFVVRGRPLHALWLPPAALVADLVVRGLPASPSAAVLSAIALGGGYAATALLLRRIRRFDARLSTPNSVIVLIAVAFATSGVVSAINAAIFAAAELLPWAAYPRATFRHWVGDLIGTLVVAPLALRVSADWFRDLGRRIDRNGLELIGQAASVAGAVWLVFGLEQTDEFKFFYLLFLPVIWVSLRYGIDGAAASLALTQVGIIVAIEYRQFNAGLVTEFQVLMLALAGTGLLIGSAVSDRRRVQALLLESEARVRAHHGELAQFARTSAVGEVASTLAHELSQPLSATSTYIGACRRLLAAPAVDLARIRAAMTKAEVQAQRAGRVLAGLRDFLYRGESHLAPEPVADILVSLRVLTQAEFERAAATLVVDDRSQGAAALVDRIQIEQALLNLVRNALEAIGEAAALERRVAIEARRAAGMVEIDVIDSGPGVPTDLLKDLFQPFATTKARGMGLGLTISRSIVEAHGGRLWYEPRPGRGSVFRLTLPVVEPDAR